MKKKIIIGVAMFIAILLVIKSMPSSDTDTLKAEIITEKEGIEKEIVEEEKKKDLPVSTLSAINIGAIEKLSNFEFIEANNYIAEKLRSYNTKDSEAFNDYLSNYNEIALMANFETIKESQEARHLRELIKNLKHPDNFLISTMWLDSSERKYILKTSESLNPIFDGGIIITSSRVINKEDSTNVKKIENSIKNIKEIIEYEVEIENNELLAYIVVDDSGRLFFYKIIEKVEGSTYYSTIAEWDDFLETVNENLNKDKSKEKIDEDTNSENIESDETEEGEGDNE